jgi:antitoxin (DNA-binding transcriptional repressor) of toxin-antitoxin stability system
MATKVTATEAARRLSDLLNRARYRGERFTILRGGEEICEIVPTARRGSVTFGELRRALAELPEPDEDFRSDLECIRSEQPPAESSWPS